MFFHWGHGVLLNFSSIKHGSPWTGSHYYICCLAENEQSNVFIKINEQDSVSGRISLHIKEGCKYSRITSLKFSHVHSVSLPRKTLKILNINFLCDHQRLKISFSTYILKKIL